MPETLPLDRSIEFAFEYDRTLPTGGKESCLCAHVRWRTVGTRRWRRFLLVADPGEGLQALDAKIDPAVYHESAAEAGRFAVTR